MRPINRIFAELNKTDSNLWPVFANQHRRQLQGQVAGFLRSAALFLVVVFCRHEAVQGKIVTKLSSSISHEGIRLNVNASVNLQVRGGSAGVIESIYGVIKPIPILNKTVEVLKSGKISSGTTEIPFSFMLKDPGEEPLEKLYETYHGGDISIQYLASVDISRGYLHKSLSATVEFIIESEKEKPISPEVVMFYITQDTQRHSLLPELKSGGFRVSGKICTLCSLSDPIEGELTVEASAVPIQSIDMHLLRVESILVGEKIATESSLIQTTQIADGDVCRGMALPIYSILPRLLTCPSIFAGPFSVEFKVTIVITFQSEQSKLHPKSSFKTLRSWHAAESVPLELIRTK
ncbi:uncharacterized protein LOC107802566 isoform X2 [Nicotiana tabacum]|uniref:Down syndrome critical region protein 3 isoform X2 n=1 Tax=Nicotiana tabacum TaxID=4097 RepID=A0A1S4AY15_TOBAC|nr:PREDICTED: Down syndrome critical region protein 3-like isoform X2 [Nicotiana tabacum]